MIQPSRYRLVQLQILLGQLLFALAANTVQPILPAVQEAMNLTVLESSILPTAYTLSLAITNLTVGIFIGSVGVRNIFLLAGLAGIGASILAGLTGSFPGLVLAFVLYGAGIGAAFTSLTTLYTHLPEKYKDFGLFHAFFGLGGIIAPAVIGYILWTGGSFQLIFWAYLALFVGNTVLLLGTKTIENRRYPDNKLANLGKALANPVLILGIIALGAYAASEIGVVTFAGNMNIATYQMDAASSGFLLSLFWVCFTVARVATDPLVRRFGVVALILAMAVGAVLAIVLWATGLTRWVFPAIGLFMGPVFPALQKYINDNLPENVRGMFNGAAYASLGGVTSLALPAMGALGEINLAYAFILSMGLLAVLGILTPILVARAKKAV